MEFELFGGFGVAMSTPNPQSFSSTPSLNGRTRTAELAIERPVDVVIVLEEEWVVIHNFVLEIS